MMMEMNQRSTVVGGNTIWADSAHYYSEFSDIKFSNFTSDPYFISFFQLDSITSYCKGWRLGENTRTV